MQTRARLVALLAAGILTLAGCGGQQDGADSGNDTADSSSGQGGAAASQPDPASPSTSPTDLPADPDGDEDLGGSGGTGGAGPTLPTSVPRSVDEAASRINAAVTSGGADRVTRFTSPSGNIYCSLAGAVVGCELGEGRMSDPGTCGDAPIRTVGRVEIRGGRPSLVCNTDTIRQPGATTLAYGRVASTGPDGVSCLSQAVGVTCVDTAARTGFFLRRGQVLLLR